MLYCPNGTFEIFQVYLVKYECYYWINLSEQNFTYWLSIKNRKHIYTQTWINPFVNKAAFQKHTFIPLLQKLKSTERLWG